VSPATTTTNLSAKVAPLGWEKPFAGTSKAAYRSKNPQSPQNILLIDNSLKTPNYTTDLGQVGQRRHRRRPVGHRHHRRRAGSLRPEQPDAELEAGHGQPVGLVQVVPRPWQAVRATATAAAGNRNWVLIGDDRLFFLFCTNAAGYGWYGRNSYCFGDLISFKPGDNYATVLAADDNYSGMSNYWSYPGQFSGYGLVSSLDFTGKVLLRNHTQLGNPVRFGLTSLNTNNGQQICGRGPMPFPNGADYSLWLLPTYVRQEDGHMRGILPGMLWMPQDRPYSDQTIVDNVVGQAGKRFLLVRTQYSSETEGAQIAFDITGPWR
jgi:hypothetical protein